MPFYFDPQKCDIYWYRGQLVFLMNQYDELLTDGSGDLLIE